MFVFIWYLLTLYWFVLLFVVFVFIAYCVAGGLRFVELVVVVIYVICFALPLVALLFVLTCCEIGYACCVWLWLFVFCFVG